MNYGFLINNDKCIGCHACSTACKSENQVPLGVYRTWVKYTEVGRYPDVSRHFQVNRCNHCENPPCVTICPVEAMNQREDGIVDYNSDICIGCKSCMQACPYNSIYIDPDTKTAEKCNFCAHRVDRGIEPACVVVCPEHAIVAGDLNDSNSEISKEIAKNNVTVRKPEQGTVPKTFYVGGHQANLTPTATQGSSRAFIWADVVAENLKTPDSACASPLTFGNGEQMVQTVFNAQHKVPWHWPVPAYLVTKGIASGIFMLIAMAALFGLGEVTPLTALVGGAVSVFFTLLTTVFLIIDLERPERFLSIIFKAQMKSWLVKGAFILISFSTLSGGWLTLEGAVYFGFLDSSILEMVKPWIFGLGLPLAVGTAIYTAFLFAQAEGRDLWQSPLLPFHFLTQAIMGGSATLVVLGLFVPFAGSFMALASTTFGISVALDLAMILLGEFGIKHQTDTATQAAHAITHGEFKTQFWGGAILVGHLIPLALCFLGANLFMAIGGFLALIGLYAYEEAFVTAPQKVPNS